MRIKSIVDKRKPYVGMVFYFSSLFTKHWNKRTIKSIVRDIIVTEENGAFCNIDRWDNLMNIENRIKLDKLD